MAAGNAITLYKEARLNIEPAYPGSTIAFTLPADATSTFGTRTLSKRSEVTWRYNDLNEEAFAQRYLASEGSIFFRKHHEYPRAFLWRILDGRKALEIQAADLDFELNQPLEANLTLLLQFSSPIRPFGIAFAEPEKKDALTVHAITTANELYTITLPREFFSKPAASEVEIDDWCKISRPALLDTRVPYRLVATSPIELLVSLDDGSVLRLSREDIDTVTWSEALYKEGGWSFGSILPWKGQATVRFNNVDMNCAAAAALNYSPDGRHIWTVCLNHKLRAWNAESGRPTVQKDLLNEIEREDDKAPPFFIGPSQSTLMSIVDVAGGVEGAQYHIVTYSPKQHQFKFWGVRDADNPELGMIDIQSDFAFIPPVDELMDTTVWNLEEFHVKPGPASWRNTELWIRARSGPTSRIYSLKFDLSEDHSKLRMVWKNDWVAVDAGPQTIDGLKLDASNPGEQEAATHGLFNPGVTEAWLDFLFYPGRFTTATLEASLNVVRKGLKQHETLKPPKGPLKERITTTIATFTAQQSESDDTEEYEELLHAQWEAFYALVKDLHRRRGESLSLAFDYVQNTPWLVLSDYLSAIRQGSEPELMAMNRSAFTAAGRLQAPLARVLPKYDAELRNTARLLNAASAFRKTFPSWFQCDFEDQIDSEILQSKPLSVIERMELVEQNSDLVGQISDENITLLVEELGVSTRELTTDLFYRAIQTLSQEEERHNGKRKQAARYGLASLLRVSQESLDIQYNILLDLLVLALFMQFDLEPDELSDDFEASDIFVEIINQLKDVTVLKWLSKVVWSHQSPTGPASMKLHQHLDEHFKNSHKLPITQTVLEGIYGHRSFDSPLPRGLKTELLTIWSRTWLTEVFKDTYDAAVDSIAGILLLQKENNLAFKFSKFLSESAWSTYLKGRMYLSLGDFAMASLCFKKPAYCLALGLFSLDEVDSINFIPLDQRDSFSDGLSKYYAHIVTLFEKVKAHSYIADFSRLALRAFSDDDQEPLQTDLLSRLFNACIQTSKFDEAFSAMRRCRDKALRTASLHTLVTTMIQQQQSARLIKFPFLSLTSDVDALINSLAQKTLNLTSSPPYHHILYSFRIARNDFRGAAHILYERLQRLKSTSTKIHDPADESLTQCYLAIINTLESVGKDDQYLLVDQRIDEANGLSGVSVPGIGQAKKLLKRRIITLEGLRKEYQTELDRAAAIETGQYAFFGGRGDEMDIL